MICFAFTVHVSNFDVLFICNLLLDIGKMCTWTHHREPHVDKLEELLVVYDIVWMANINQQSERTCINRIYWIFCNREDAVYIRRNVIYMYVCVDIYCMMTQISHWIIGSFKICERAKCTIGQYHYDSVVWRVISCIWRYVLLYSDIWMPLWSWTPFQITQLFSSRVNSLVDNDYEAF